MKKFSKNLERNQSSSSSDNNNNVNGDKKREEGQKIFMAKDKKFSSKCLIGNWPSEKLKQDEDLREFLEKRERGELLVQKTAKVFEHFLAESQLSSCTSTYVCFDQAIQLIACDMPKIHSNGQPMALSVVVNEPHINRCQEIDQHCEISCAHSPKPTVRNTFIIRRPLMRKHRRQCCNNNNNISTSTDSQYLKYGQDLLLECYESKQKPLMLYSSPQSPFDINSGGGNGAVASSSSSNDYVFKVHGEMKQSVGLALAKDSAASSALENLGNFSHHQYDTTTIPKHFFHWRMFHINPAIRYETIGEHIPINAKVVIQHTSTGRNLCCENAVISTIFGLEFGVSCHNEKDIYGVEKVTNVWEISTSKSS